MKDFEVTIASLDEVKFNGMAHSVTMPGIAGDFTVLKDHMPLVTSLRKGEIVIHGEEDKTFEVEKGIAEVSDGGVMVLV